MWTWTFISALVGAIVALAAYYASPGRIRGGLLLTMAVGAVGGVVSTWLGRQVGMAMPYQTLGFFTAVMGTALIIAIWRVAMGRS